jgi:hypothetical protein
VLFKFFNVRRSNIGKTEDSKTGKNGNIQSIAPAENK